MNFRFFFHLFVRDISCRMFCCATCYLFFLPRQSTSAAAVPTSQPANRVKKNAGICSVRGRCNRTIRIAFDRNYFALMQKVILKIHFLPFLHLTATVTIPRKPFDFYSSELWIVACHRLVFFIFIFSFVSYVWWHWYARSSMTMSMKMKKGQD